MTVALITNMENFNKAIASETLVVVDFYADWCGPCKFISPQLAKLSEEMAGSVLFYKVDIDQLSFDDISSVPTFRFFKKGQMLKEFCGANIAGITQIINELK